MAERNINEIETKITNVWRRENGTWSIEIPNTISCIELIMRHDKRGHVIGWMESEPRIDSWDGSVDNQIMILEDKEPERRVRKFLELK